MSRMILVLCLLLPGAVDGALPGEDKKPPAPEEVLTSYGVELDVRGLITALSNQHPTVRENAAIVLGKRKEKSAIPKLKSELEDPYMYARLAAAGALLQLGDLSGDSLLTEVGNSRDSQAALYAASILLANGDSRAFNAVVQITETAEQPMDRVDAIRVLSSMRRFKEKEDVIVAVLIRMLGDPDINVRRASAGELREFRKTDVVDAFKKALADPDEVVHGLAEQYLLDYNKEKH